ncbi:RDD family protein [Streptomyces sparsogenes]|uniref:RDD family protein n=1 Tax=Streptomyces sparsogenes TaxID=67365 RepID=UPI0033193022
MRNQPPTPGWRPATSTERLHAKLVDFGIGGVILLGSLIVAVPLLAMGGAAVALFLLAWIGFVVWALVREGRTGQTWGRKRVGLYLVSGRTGRPIGAWKLFLRSLLTPVEVPVFFLKIKGGRLFDWHLDLQVIKLAPGAPLPQGPLPRARSLRDSVSVDPMNLLPPSLS